MSLEMTMTSQEEVLSLLNEFYSPSCKNERKHEIEVTLSAFKTSRDCVQTSILFLKNSKQLLVHMFALHCLQEYVEGESWLLASTEQQALLRSAVWPLLQYFWPQRLVVPVVVSKLIQLTSTLALVDFDAQFANFQLLVSKWLSSSESAPLALQLLKGALDAFRASSGRCQSVTIRQRSVRVPIFRIWIGRLRPLFAEMLRAETSAVLATIGVVELPNFLHDTEGLIPSEGVSTVEAELLSLTVDTLDCLSWIFGQMCWPDFASTLATDSNCAEILNCLLILGEVGLLKGRQSNAELIKITEYSIKALLEVCSKPFQISSQSDQTQLFPRSLVFYFSRNLNRLLDHGIDEDLLMTFLELLTYFVHHQLPRLKGETVYLERFYSTLIAFTRNTVDPPVLQRLLHVWTLTLDHLALAIDESSIPTCLDPITDRLVTELCSILLLSYIPSGQRETAFEQHFDFPKDAMAPIETTDKDECEEDSWQHLLMSLNGVTLELSRFNVNHVYAAFYREFDSRLKLLFEVNSVRQMDARSVDHYVMVMQNLLSALSALSHTLLGEQRFPLVGKQVTERFCEAVVFISEQQLFSHSEAIGNLYTGLLLCLRSHCQWLALFYADAQRTGGQSVVDASSVITACIDQLAPLILLHSLDEHLRTAAVSLLYSLLTTVRPHRFVLQMNSFSRLVEFVATLEQQHNSAAKEASWKRILRLSLVDYLLLPWFDLSDEEQAWTERRSLCARLLDPLCTPLISALRQTPVQPQKVAGCLVNTVPSLVEILDSVSTERATTKMLLTTMLRPLADLLVVIDYCRLAATTAVSSAVLEGSLQLIGGLLSSLSVSLGPNYVKATVEMLLQLTATAQDDNSNAVGAMKMSSRALLALVAILKVIVRETSKSFAQFIENIVTLAVHSIHAAVTKYDDSAFIETREAYYDLLFTLVENRWRYFFPTRIANPIPSAVTSTRDTSVYFSAFKADTPAEVTVELIRSRGDQLVNIMQVIGHSLETETTPSVVQNNLWRLDALQQKWNLYGKPVFVSRLLSAYLELFLTSLLERRLPLVEEELLIGLYRLVWASNGADDDPTGGTSATATVDFFRHQFLPAYLTKRCLLPPSAVHLALSSFVCASDQPSFVVDVAEFITTVRISKNTISVSQMQHDGGHSVVS